MSYRGVKIDLKKIIFTLAQFFIIWAIYMISEYIVEVFHLPVPASVLGIIILFTALSTKVIKLKYIDRMASFFNNHLSFFFLPYAVGIMSFGGLIKSSGFEILFIIIVSTTIGLFITSGISQFLTKKELAKHDHSNSV